MKNVRSKVRDKFCTAVTLSLSVLARAEMKFVYRQICCRILVSLILTIHNTDIM